MRALAPVAALLILLAPTAFAAPLSAVVRDATLVIELGDGLPRDVQVVVLHADERTWVDRVVRVPDRTARPTLHLDGLPRESTLSVHVLDGATVLPRLARAPAYLDAAAIAAIEPIAKTTVGPIEPSAANGALPIAFVPVPELYGREIFTLADGTILLLHGANGGSMGVRVSTDRGTTFSNPVQLVGPGPSEPLFGAGLTGDGHLVFFSSRYRWIDDPNDYEPGYGSLERWRYARFDPVALKVVAEREFTIDGLFLDGFHGAVLPGPGHSVYVAYSNSHVRLDAAGRPTVVDSTQGVRLAEIQADGTTKRLPDVPGAPYAQSLKGDRGPDGMLGLMGTIGGAGLNESMRAWISTSTTGPAGFSLPVNVSVGRVPEGGYQVYAQGFAFDAKRNAHGVFVANRLNDGNYRVEGYHTRLSPDGSFATRAVRDHTRATPEATFTGLGIVASGKSVYVTWSANEPGTETQRWLQRSADGGDSWPQPLRVRSFREPHGIDLIGNRPLAALPDGRVVLQALSGSEGLGFPFEPQQPPGSRLDAATPTPTPTPWPTPYTPIEIAPPPTARWPAPPPTSPPPPYPSTGPVLVGEVDPEFVTIARGATARIQATMTNREDQAHWIFLSVQPDPTSSRSQKFRLQPDAVLVQPRETIAITGALSLPEDGSVAPGRIRANLVAATEDGRTSRSGAFSLAWDGDVPVASPPPPYPTAQPPPYPTSPPSLRIPVEPTPIPGAGALVALVAVVAVALLRRAMVK